MSKFRPTKQKWFAVASAVFLLIGFNFDANAEEITDTAKPRNVIYILTDDQRFDELGFMNPVLD
ncbi:MAG: hypothetical protein ACPG3T_06175, partial [Pseudomonadales bacterium]